MSSSFPSDPSQLFGFVFHKVSRLVAQSGGSSGSTSYPPRFLSNPLAEQSVEANCSLMNSLLVHLYAINRTECERTLEQIGSSQVDQSNARHLANELLLAYLFEVERLCDQTNVAIDQVMQHFESPPKAPATVAPSPPVVISLGRISAWQENLQCKLDQLTTGRLVLLDLAQRYPLPQFHQTNNVLIALQAHTTATCENAHTVACDAQLILYTLAWYRDLVQYCMQTSPRK